MAQRDRRSLRKVLQGDACDSLHLCLGSSTCALHHQSLKDSRDVAGKRNAIDCPIDNSNDRVYQATERPDAQSP